MGQPSAGAHDMTRDGRPRRIQRARARHAGRVAPGSRIRRDPSRIRLAPRPHRPAGRAPPPLPSPTRSPPARRGATHVAPCVQGFQTHFAGRFGTCPSLPDARTQTSSPPGRLPPLAGAAAMGVIDADSLEAYQAAIASTPHVRREIADRSWDARVGS